MDRKAHWQTVYQTKGEDEVSWFQERPGTSFALIGRSGVARNDAILDVGGGASRLIDHILDAGYGDLTVLDIAEAALVASKARLGDRARSVCWEAADITQWTPSRRYALWHDRAVFHFLIDAADRAAYVRALDAALAPGGQVIIGTFAPDGPERCSGLPIQRYDAAALGAVIGEGFALEETCGEEHLTPGGAIQRFQFCRFRRL